MAGRGTSNSPNTRNPMRPASSPSRLDQFADDMFDKEKTKKNESIFSKKESKSK